MSGHPARRMRSVRTAAQTAFRANRKHALALLTLAVLQVVATMAVGLGLKAVVSAALAHDDGRLHAMTLAAALSSALLFSISVARARVATTVNDEVAGEFDHAVMSLTGRLPGVSHYETKGQLDRLEVIRQHPTALAQSYSVLVNTAVLIAQASVVIGIFVWVAPVLGLLPLLAIPGVLTMGKGHAIAAASFRASSQDRRIAARLFALATSQDSGAEIRLSGARELLVDRRRAAWGDLNQTITRAEWQAAGIQDAGRSLFFLGYVGAIAWTVHTSLTGANPAGDAILVVVIAGVINAQVSSVVDVLRRSGYVLSVMREFAWLTDLVETSATEHHEGTAHNGSATSEGPFEGIQLKDVTFSYPGSEEPILKGISLDLAPGEVVALVGPNGAGKTTVVKLLSGMYQPTGGKVLVSGKELATVDLARWRQRMTAVFQDFCRFEFEMRESVSIGDLQHLGDDGRVLQALSSAQADDLLARLDGNLSTELGDSLPDGIGLSGGEWQKVAVARALMREETSLMVLDEPSASLDAEAEAELFRNYSQIARSMGSASRRVTLLVSHRLTSVRAADRVVVLGDGILLEDGSHDELMVAAGPYAEWVNTQARGYD